MAEAVVGLVVGKLGAALLKEAARYGTSLLCHEVSALKGLFGQIREAKDELESMQAYLKGAERFKDTDETTSLFVQRIRAFAFEIEDVVDKFTYTLEDKHGGLAARTKKRIKHVKTWHRLARKLHDINGRLQGAKQRNQQYAMDRNAGGSAFHVNQALNFTRDEDLVGIAENKEKLTQWLAGDLEQRCKIATVWGMPGVGKTTLVAHVYKAIKMDFDAAAWVTVSQTYDVHELLRKIAREFGIRTDAANMEIGRVAEAIYNYLQGKRYILVLDDVWTADVWSEIRSVFPSNCIGRFMITSSKHEVSLLGTSNSAIHHLEPLEEDLSWELFCKSAFWNGADRKCPSHLNNLASKFVEKCEGLPIAIACIGSLLSGRGQTYAEWKKTYDELELQLIRKVMPCVETILKVSLEDLPYDLKNCFLHCALFPEDYIIKRGRVTRHWIASGFIKKMDNKTLEEVAGDYLIELVNRSLLQVVQRNDTGRLKCCRMHDVIRLVALRKADEECFGKVYDGREFSVARIRRISILSGNLDQISPSNASHIRSLHVFESYIDIDLLRAILASSNLLSTLDLQGVCIKMLPSEVFNLFNLRYLGLRYTAIESLSETIGRLQNLEVLDVVNSRLSYLPKNIVKLRKLRYLYAGYVFQGREIKPSSGAKVPSGIRHLTSLQALQCVEASLKILCEVGNLTELRTLGVCNVRREHSSNLRNAINKMSHLVHLEISSLGQSEVLQLEGLLLPPTLSWLHLEGQLAKTSMPQVLSSWSHLNSLTKLQMSFSKIDEESFPSLLVLHGLCVLSLINAFVGKKLHFTTGCFPKLRLLSIWHAPQLNRVQIEEGAMPSVAKVCFDECRELEFLPQGIEHLKNLEELYLHDTSEELREKLREKEEPNQCKDDLMSIRHIRKVIVT